MLPGRRSSARLTRTALAVLLLLCFAGIQTASAITEQIHDHGPSHTDCCAICHAGHASVIQAALVFSLEAPLNGEWQTPVEGASEIPEIQARSQSSRAPPR